MQTKTEPETAKDIRAQLLAAKDALSNQFPDKSIYVSYSIANDYADSFNVIIDSTCGCGDTMQEAVDKAIRKLNGDKAELIRRAKEMGLTVTEGVK